MTHDWEEEFDKKFQSLKFVHRAKDGGEKEQWKYRFTLRRAVINENTMEKQKDFIRELLHKLAIRDIKSNQE